MSIPLRQTACLHCDGAGLELHHDGQIICKYCGLANTLPGTICPRCEYVSVAGAEFCENCQRPLFRVCPDCQTKNWSGVGQCTQCGRPLDTLDGLIGSLQENTDSRLYRQQRESAGIKEREEQAAERRLAQLRAIDDQRLKAQSQAMARRSTREQQVISTVLVIAGLVAVAVVVAVILALLPR